MKSVSLIEMCKLLENDFTFNNSNFLLEDVYFMSLCRGVIRWLANN